MQMEAEELGELWLLSISGVDQGPEESRTTNCFRVLRCWHGWRLRPRPAP